MPFQLGLHFPCHYLGANITERVILVQIVIQFLIQVINCSFLANLAELSLAVKLIYFFIHLLVDILDVVQRALCCFLVVAPHLLIVVLLNF